MSKSFLLTKTKFVQGYGCKKSTWLEFYKPVLKEEMSLNDKHNIDEGHFIDEMDKKHPYYAGGIYIKNKNPKTALNLTSTYITKTDRMYEPAFKFSYKNIDCFVRCDILIKNSDGSFDIVEVKSASSVKKHHLIDVAYQKWVLEQSGHKVNRVFLMHVDGTWNCDTNDVEKIDKIDYFHIEEIGNELKQYSSTIANEVHEHYLTLNNKIEPTREVGSHCKNPYNCPFKSHCWKNINNDSVEYLSRISSQKRDALKNYVDENGYSNPIKYIKDIPNNFNLTPRQSIQRDCAKSKTPFYDIDSIDFWLKDLVYPLYHLDFEAYNKSLPPFKGVRPNQFVCFQASIHKEYKSRKKELEHSEFLHTKKSDPRKGMIEYLINNLGKKGSIVVYYAPFERTRLKEMARDFPKYANELNNIANRIVDLADIFKNTLFYHDAMLGSASIKKVLPVIAPEFSYDRLLIGNGNDAMAYYSSLIKGDFKGGKFHQIKKALLEYCKLDTMAMVIIKRNLEDFVKHIKKGKDAGEFFAHLS